MDGRNEDRFHLGYIPRPWDPLPDTPPRKQKSAGRGPPPALSHIFPTLFVRRELSASVKEQRGPVA